MLDAKQHVVFEDIDVTAARDRRGHPIGKKAWQANSKATAGVFFEASTIGLAVEIRVEGVDAISQRSETTLRREHAGTSRAEGETTAVNIEV